MGRKQRNEPEEDKIPANTQIAQFPQSCYMFYTFYKQAVFSLIIYISGGSINWLGQSLYNWWAPQCPTSDYWIGALDTWALPVIRGQPTIIQKI